MKGKNTSDTLVIRGRVRKFVAKRGRRVSKEFFLLLDRHVKRLIESACDVHNGGKQTLDAAVGAYVGMKG